MSTTEPRTITATEEMADALGITPRKGLIMVPVPTRGGYKVKIMDGDVFLGWLAKKEHSREILDA